MRFTIRGMMVVVALVAIGIAVPIAVERYIRKAMNDFYGPGGYLEHPNRYLDQRGKPAGKL